MNLVSEFIYRLYNLDYIRYSLIFIICYNITASHAEGPDYTQISGVDFSTISPILESRAHNNSGRVSLGHPRQISGSGREGIRGKTTKRPRIEEDLSTDCNAKRDEVLRRQKHNHDKDTRSPGWNTHNINYHRLVPRLNTTSTPSNLTLNLHYDVENEHVPQCTRVGTYEPIQCHKIGYCWCVNKFGQAIKNSATSAVQRPDCDKAYYESSTDGPLVITGVSSQNLKQMLKEKSSSSSNVTIETDTDLEQEHRYGDRAHDNEFNKRVSASLEPSLSLIPNDCALSQEKSKERAKKYPDASIWIPDCDPSKVTLYASKQCHQGKVCWCVDQTTGLPLRSNEQLSKQIDINCTEISRIVSLSTGSTQELGKNSFFRGFSGYCDADKRYEFVLSLMNQFKQQYADYIRNNPTFALSQKENLIDPMKLSEEQVSRWLFAIMDTNVDGKLNDREWSRFKMNFKLVDKMYDSNTQNQRSDFNPNYPHAMPLYILRSQRRCWRDFLEFCGNGNILNEVSINLSKWLSCTELPNITWKDGTQQVSDIHAYSRAAAIARSKYKNPFLGVLKPD